MKYRHIILAWFPLPLQNSVVQIFHYHEFIASNFIICDGSLGNMVNTCCLNLSKVDKYLNDNEYFLNAIKTGTFKNSFPYRLTLLL